MEREERAARVRERRRVERREGKGKRGVRVGEWMRGWSRSERGRMQEVQHRRTTINKHHHNKQQLKNRKFYINTINT